MNTRVTVTLPAEVSRRARARAAREGTTLSAVVRSQLEEFAAEVDLAEEADDVRLVKDVEARIARREVAVRDWAEFEAELDAEADAVPRPR
jgi:hypothetical protein